MNYDNQNKKTTHVYRYISHVLSCTRLIQCYSDAQLCAHVEVIYWNLTNGTEFPFVLLREEVLKQLKDNI